LPKSIFTSIGFIVMQIVAIILTLVILTMLLGILRESDYGFPPSPYILQNCFGHFADYYLHGILSVPDRRAGIRIIIACIFLEGTYWYVRKAFLRIRKASCLS
jgi:hypothetical protein